MMVRLLPVFLLMTMGCPTKDDVPSDSRVDDVLALTGNAADGAADYTARCATCHAADGTGGVAPLDLNEEVPASTDEDILTVIIDGDGSMPSFGANTDDQGLADLLAHLNDAFGG